MFSFKQEEKKPFSYARPELAEWASIDGSTSLTIKMRKSSNKTLWWIMALVLSTAIIFALFYIL